MYPKMQEVIELGGNKANTTNNAMEMTAIISALSYAAMNDAPTHVYTDSSYAINGITKWVHGWIKNGWLTQAKEPVKNKELWQAMHELVTARQGATSIDWHHVPGHVGIAGNERVDTIANEFASGKHPELYRGPLATYSIQNIIDIDEKTIIESRQKKAAAKGKAYCYVSYVDGQVRRHESWPDCESHVKGKNAKFRKALNEEHVAEILKEWGVSE